MLLQIFCMALLIDVMDGSITIEKGPSGKILKICNYTGPFPVDKMQCVDEISIYDSTISCAVGRPSFDRIKKFSTNCTKFVDVPKHRWLDFPNVTEASEENTQTEGMKLSKYNIYTAFETFSLSHVQLGKLTNNALNNLKCLKKLSLSDAGITGIENGVFSGLNKLEYLGLDDNNLSNFPREMLAPLKNLKTLCLKGNQIEKFGPENLPYLPELKTIYLEKNPVKYVDVGQLKKKAPKLEEVKTDCDCMSND